MLTTQKKTTYLAIGTFFLVMTAQIFWSTIHGDGAVYAWIIREITEAGFFSSQLPHWTQTQVFAEHPYLFFYLSSFFTQLFGYSDLVLKLPNFVVAAFSIWTVYQICLIRHPTKEKSYQIGLIAGYALILNNAYLMQISQPTLDPLTQLLALASVVFYIFFRRSFLAGFLLGLSFLTKGLELLPHLAALFMLTCWLNRNHFSQLFKQLLLQFLGLSLPLFIWLGMDHFIWSGQWLATYWSRQFTNRFLRKENNLTLLDFSILVTFFKVYFIEFTILSLGLWKSKVWARKSDPLFIYFCFYLVFNLSAFFIIKKDSTQHLTGLILLGSVFVGEFIWEASRVMQWKHFKWAPLLIFVLSFTYWSWFVLGPRQNSDIWSSIRTASRSMASENKIIVIKDQSAESYGLFYTTQWYFYPNKVYFQSEVSQLTNQLFDNQKVLFIDNDVDGKLKTNAAVGQENAL